MSNALLRRNLLGRDVNRSRCQVASILSWLATGQAGLAENTIAIHDSDHGGVIARSKRQLFNSGTPCPLVIRIPKRFQHLRPDSPGSQIDELVSFIDMPKTWLSAVSAVIPDTIQGKISLGLDAENRDYHVSFRSRMDARCDNVRAIRDGKNLHYIRNYMPYAPWGQYQSYLGRMRATGRLLILLDAIDHDWLIRFLEHRIVS